jgi:hypothetical protein
MVTIQDISCPIPPNEEQYGNQIIKYRKIYPAIKELGK